MTDKNQYSNLSETIRMIGASNLRIQDTFLANSAVESQKHILKMLEDYKVSQSRIARTLELLSRPTVMPSVKAQLESMAQMTRQMGLTLSPSLASTAKVYSDTLATINALAGFQIPLPKVGDLLSDIEEHPEAYDVTPEKEALVDAFLEARSPGLLQAINKIGDVLHLSDPTVRRRYVWGIKSVVFGFFVAIYIALGGKDFETFASFGKDMGVNPLQIAIETGEHVSLLLDAKFSDEGEDKDGR